MSSTHKPQRDSLIDAIRGLAVTGMILAHALFFFHDGTNQFLNSLQQLLNVTIFTVFIFVSGMTLSYWWDTHEEHTTQWRRVRLLRRLLYLYCGFVIIGGLGVITANQTLPIQNFFRNMVGIVTMVHPPNFTEYIPLFILLTLTLIVGENIYKNLRHSLLKTSLVGIGLYTIGFAVYPFLESTYFSSFISLFVGKINELRFPLLSYLPVFLMGMWWQNEKRIQKKIGLLITFLLLIVVSIFISKRLEFSAFDLATRWPPSPGFLALGMSLAGILSILLPLHYRFRWSVPIYRLFAYIGQIAFAVWFVHLPLLFLYRRFDGLQFSTVPLSLLAFIFLFVLSLALVALGNVHQFSLFSKSFFKNDSETTTPIKSTYILFTLFIGIVLLLIIPYILPASTYGDVRPLPTSPKLSIVLPTNARLVVSTNRKWYIRSYAASDTITVTVTLQDNTQQSLVLPESLVIVSIDGKKISYEQKQQTQDSISIHIPTNTLKSGIHLVDAKIADPSYTIPTQPTYIQISEPLMVAWTLDWEGWDATDKALETIDEFSSTYHIPFTHFVSPRTFLDTTLRAERREEIVQFLRKRDMLHDEIAMHLHMHFDFVQNAGVTRRTNQPWGLRTNEGYDIPTDQYSAEEFRTLIQYGLSIMEQMGLPRPVGYRAGGWFLSSPQLQVLESEGFLYDSSAREKPSTGAFRTIPWNLTDGLQPYYPDDEDQNKASPYHIGILEIPNNSGNTFEFTSTQILQQINQIMGPLPIKQPTVAVIVSHPQFSEREFVKIPEILPLFSSQLFANDQGPVVFVTMSEILNTWKTYLP